MKNVCELFRSLCSTIYRRAISSSSVDGVCAMLNHACTLIEQDFREVLYSRVRAGFPSGFDLSQAYNMVQSSIQQGKLQSSDTEKTKSLFLVCITTMFFFVLWFFFGTYEAI